MQRYYRATVYRSRSVDPTETAVLVPTAAGAAHADPFQVTTHPALAGWKPYLEVPQGRQGSVDPVKKVGKIATFTVGLIDKQLNGNAVRWVTAFAGDASSRPQLAGCKVFVEYADDTGGALAWLPFATGRIRQNGLDGRAKYQLTCKGFGDDLKTTVFNGTPHANATAAQRANFAPFGLTTAWGPFTETVPKLRGTISGNAGNLNGVITIDTTYSPARTRIITKALADATAADSGYLLNFENARVALKRLDTLATGEFYVALGAPGKDPAGHALLMTCTIIQTEGGLAVPPNGTPVEFTIFPKNWPVSANVPILISDVHPVQLLADLLDGYYGPLNSATGNPLVIIARDATTFTALLADATLPKLRYLIDAAEPMNTFIEREIFQTCHLTYRFDASGKFALVDLRGASARPIASAITDGDLDTTSAPDWTHNPDEAITRMAVSIWSDTLIPDVDLNAIGDRLPDLPVIGITSVENPSAFFDISPRALDIADVGTNTLEIKAKGLRYRDGETTDGIERKSWLQRVVGALRNEIRAAFALGPLRFREAFRRTANTDAAMPGTFHTLTISTMPNVGNSQRGGTRTLLCVERGERGGVTDLGFVDLGSTTPTAAPVLAAPAVVATRPHHDFTCGIALSGVIPAEIWACVTPAGTAVRPVDSDTRWKLARSVSVGVTQNFVNYASGTRVWLRARSMPAASDDFKAPSAWTYPSSGTGYVDLTAITAPNTVATANLAGGSTDVTWVVGDPAYEVEVLFTIGAAPGTWADTDRLELKREGSNRTSIDNLTPSTNYTVGIRHRDRYGGSSAVAALNFNTTAVAATCPAMKGLAVLSAGGN
jgi:hypothetical protein